MKAEAEAMREKAEAYKQYGEAAVIQMVVERLPEIAQHISAPLATTEKWLSLIMVVAVGLQKSHKM